VVKLLLNAGADVEAKDADGYFALFIAAQEGHPKVVKLLLDAGADKDKTANGQTSLSIATNNGHTEVVQLLLDARTDAPLETHNPVRPILGGNSAQMMPLDINLFVMLSNELRDLHVVPHLGLE
jgi:ankyrin repeat protein